LGRRASVTAVAEKIRVQVGPWDQLEQAARAVRFAVFIEEQGIPAALELDEHDAQATHAVAFDASGKPLATGRLLPDAHIGRMAVLATERGKGLGVSILRSLVAMAAGRGDSAVRLHAQTSAIGFYVREGFVAQGEVYLEAGIPHQDMVRVLNPVVAPDAAPASTGGV
jgi:predicted GNAT family N-acyltransferase